MGAMICRAALMLSMFAASIPAQSQPPVVDSYPGATMLPAGSVATIVQPPGINSRIGPGATPQGVVFPPAGQLMQGTRHRATQSAPATSTPPCSRGWVQVFSLDDGRDIVAGNRNVWMCRGDGPLTYATVSTPDAGNSAAVLPSPSTASPAPRAAAATAASQSRAPAPNPPVAIVVSPSGGDAIQLNWNASTDRNGAPVGGYRIERCTGPSCRDFREIANRLRPPFADTGLAPSTTYLYRIRAYDSAGNHSDYTNVSIATTLPPLAALPDLAIAELKVPPTGIIGGQISVSAVAVNKGATATGAYRLAFYFSNDQSATTFSGTYCEMAPLAPGATWPCSGTVAAPSTLTPGTYWLVAFADDLGHVAEKDKNNNTGAVRIALTAALTAAPAANTSAAATAAPPPIPPTIASPGGLSAALTGGGSIQLRWNSPPAGSPAPVGYKIERCSGSGCGNFSQVATSISTSHADAAITPGTSYSYRVRAFDSAGNSSNYSNAATAVIASAIFQDPGNRQ